MVRPARDLRLTRELEQHPAPPRPGQQRRGREPRVLKHGPMLPAFVAP